MTDLHQTPSQTVGPFFGYALPYDGGDRLLPPHAHGTIRLHGTIFDGAGEVVPDAIVEIWQADAAGSVVSERGSLHRDGYTFTGFGRAAVDDGGHYSFTTVKPGRMRTGSSPYVMVTIFARGLLHHLFTRAYFGDDAPDSVVRELGERGVTLVAQPDGDASYRFDIRLQGEQETVFFDYGVDAGA